MSEEGGLDRQIVEIREGLGRLHSDLSRLEGLLIKYRDAAASEAPLGRRVLVAITVAARVLEADEGISRAIQIIDDFSERGWV